MAQETSWKRIWKKNEEPEFVEKSDKTVSFEHDTSITLVNSLQLWLPVQDMHKTGLAPFHHS